MHDILQGHHHSNVILTMSSLSEWRVAAVKVKGFRSVSAWLEVHLPQGNLIGIVGPNGGTYGLERWPSCVCSICSYRLGNFSVPGRTTGCGKSTLLTAICCAFGCSSAVLGVHSLTELRSTDTDEVSTPCSTPHRCHTVHRRERLE